MRDTFGLIVYPFTSPLFTRSLPCLMAGRYPTVLAL
jgi:hypothetical protein